MGIIKSSDVYAAHSIAPRITARNYVIKDIFKIIFLIGMVSLFSCTTRLSTISESTTEDQGVESVEELDSGEVVKSTVDDTQAQILIGKANLQLEDYDKAIEAFNEAISKQPELKEQVDTYLADAYMFSAQAKLKAQEFEESVKRFQKMVEIDFRRLEANITDVIDAYKGWAKSKTSDSEIDEIFESFNVLSKLSPNNIGIIMGAGEIAFEVGRYAKALEYFNKAKDIDATVAPTANDFIGKIYLSRAKNYFEKGEYEKAIENFDDAKSTDSKLEEEVNKLLVDAYIKYGEVLSKKGNFEEAEKFWNKCMELSPDNTLVYRNLGQMYLDQGKDEKALNLFNMINELEPENLSVLEKIADIYLNLRKTKQAQDVMVKILGLDNEHLYGRFNKSLADMYFDDFKYNSAIKYYLDYLSFTPGDAEVAYQVARCYSFTKEYALAQEYYTQAVSIDSAWKNKGGFYWGFKLYRLRVLFAVIALVLLSGVGFLLYYLISRHKLQQFRKVA